MKARILGTVSALTLLMAVTAYTEANASAGVNANANASVSQNTTTEDFQQGLKDAGHDAAEAAKGAGRAVKSAYQDIKAKLISSTQGEPTDVTISSRITADGMLGEPIYNNAGAKVATVKDIILDQNGNAEMIVVSDGGFMGIGDKLAAFDYDRVMRQEANGDVIMPLTEDEISNVAAFSYDLKDKSDKVQVVPANGYSVAELLKGKLTDPGNNPVADVENITFAGGKASQVIVSFDQTLGLGGEKAVLNFSDLTLVRDRDESINFRMSANQAANFETFKANAKAAN